MATSVAAPNAVFAATVVSFTTTGSTTWIAPCGVTTVDYLVVAGGGGGGSAAGGGGGAGGLLTGTLSVTAGNSYTVTVGAGGASNTSGNNSVFSSVTAVGGGLGGTNSANGAAGGSGGGSGGVAPTTGGAGTAGQGNAGGNGYVPSPYATGGGGGSGAVGSNGIGSASGAGGAGTSSSISGSSVTYAGGGGGGGAVQGASAGAAGSGGGGAGGSGSANGSAGIANTGGGGGGGGNSFSGGAGGSGIVILSFTGCVPPSVTFNGNVKFAKAFSVTGSLTKGSGTFEIDHPQYPETMILVHSFVESPDVMNLYDGIAMLDANGEVVIRLPLYFDALNRDPRYQFFPMDQAMPNLYVKEEEHDNQFVIAGGKPGGQISWQITGIRRDPYILMHPIIVEVLKGPGQPVNKGECVFKPNCDDQATSSDSVANNGDKQPPSLLRRLLDFLGF